MRRISASARRIVVAAVTAVALGVAGFAATSLGTHRDADAAGNITDCRSNTVCFYRTPYYSSVPGYALPGMRAHDLRPWGWNDSIRGLRNLTGYTYCFYLDIDFKGPAIWLTPGRSIEELLYTKGLSNSISSFKPC